MKKSAILAIVFLAFAVSVNAAGPNNGNHFRQDPGRHQQTKPGKPGNNQKPVGAPLDGGLLLILGGAGAAYYASKKRKASEEK